MFMSVTEHEERGKGRDTHRSSFQPFPYPTFRLPTSFLRFFGRRVATLLGSRSVVSVLVDAFEKNLLLLNDQGSSLLSTLSSFSSLSFLPFAIVALFSVLLYPPLVVVPPFPTGFR